MRPINWCIGGGNGGKWIFGSHPLKNYTQISIFPRFSPPHASPFRGAPPYAVGRVTAQFCHTINGAKWRNKALKP